jgi:hypothetical protein
VVEKPGAKFKMMPVVFDQVRSDEYLIEMLFSGICHTVCTNLTTIEISWADSSRTSYCSMGSSEIYVNIPPPLDTKEQALYERWV